MSQPLEPSSYQPIADAQSSNQITMWLIWLDKLQSLVHTYESPVNLAQRTRISSSFKSFSPKSGLPMILQPSKITTGHLNVYQPFPSPGHACTNGNSLSRASILRYWRGRNQSSRPQMSAAPTTWAGPKGWIYPLAIEHMENGQFIDDLQSFTYYCNDFPNS